MYDFEHRSIARTKICNLSACIPPVVIAPPKIGHPASLG